MARKDIWVDRLKKFSEAHTYFPVVRWEVSPEAQQFLSKSSGTLVIAGNMPDKVASGKDRYQDTPERWHAQKAAIDLEFEEWSREMIGSGQKTLTVALCSGARGVDLDTYETIQRKRAEVRDQGIKIQVISFLPLEVDSFRKESVEGSIREKEYVKLFQDLLTDPDAIVHQPQLVWYSPKQKREMEERAEERGVSKIVYGGIVPPHVKVPVTGDFAYSHSEDINGKDNAYINFSDTQRQLMKAVLSTRHPIKARFMIVADGGDAYGPGGTNEMVARIFDMNEYGPYLKRRARKQLPTIRVIQDGLTVKEDRKLPWYIDEPYSKGYGQPVYRNSVAYIDRVRSGYKEILQPHTRLRAKAEYTLRRRLGRYLVNRLSTPQNQEDK
ncbi:MAG TPA: hypothetical protein VF189_01735 [Patescibacteria group bacterium]